MGSQNKTAHAVSCDHETGDVGAVKTQTEHVASISSELLSQIARQRDVDPTTGVSHGAHGNDVAVRLYQDCPDCLSSLELGRQGAAIAEAVVQAPVWIQPRQAESAAETSQPIVRSPADDNMPVALDGDRPRFVSGIALRAKIKHGPIEAWIGCIVRGDAIYNCLEIASPSNCRL